MVEFKEKVTKEDFEAEVMVGKVVLDIYKDGCSPCIALAPHVDEINELGKVKVVKLNGEKNPAIASRFGIMGFPALFLIEDGVIVEKAVGGNITIALANKLKETL